MKIPIWSKVLLVVCCLIVILPMLTQRTYASEDNEHTIYIQQKVATPLAEEDDDGGILDTITSILEKLRNLPNKLSEGIVEALKDASGDLAFAVMGGVTTWLVKNTLSGAETVFTSITASSANIFNYSWFKVIVGVFRCFGVLLFAVGVVLALVDVGVEYRRRGADLSGAMLNLGKGLLAVGLFSTVPVPLYKFCANIQSVIMDALAINWSFQSISDAISAKFTQDLMMIIMLIIIIVLMVIIYLDTLKRGGILLVQICIGSLYMISVPRGYMDNFYGWCKQIIALCLTTLFQNLLMFCGLMIIPTNLFLGIGTMFAAKEVPRICGQFGLDTSVKASFTGMAIGANASVQAIKAAMTILA